MGAGAIYRGGPVEGGTGDAASGADFAKKGPRAHEVAGLHGDGLEVGVEGVETEAVVEDDGVAGEVERLGGDDPAALRGGEGGGPGGREVDSTRRRTGRATEEAGL